jgi:hypothetical protein
LFLSDVTFFGVPKTKTCSGFKKPFHAAEQRSKERISGSAERKRLSETPSLCEQRRAVPHLCGAKWTAALFGSFLGKQK